MKVRKVITGILVIVSLLVGISSLCWGIGETVRFHNQTRNYQETEGYFVDYNVYTERHSHKPNRYKLRIYNSRTYQLTYAFSVDGSEYTVSSDYGVGNLPEQGSSRKILYNPYHPEQAVVEGINGNSILIYMGILFTAVPLIFLFVFLIRRGHFRNLRINGMDVIIGVVFLAVGIGFVYGLTGSLSPVQAFQALGILIGIPVLFVLIGILLLLRGLFFQKKQKRSR